MHTKTMQILASLCLGCAFLMSGGTDVQAHKIVRPGLRLGPVSFELRSGHRKLPTFYHRGRLYTIGTKGANYSIFIRNRTAQRLEVVVAVDGRDVITGERATHFRRRGYILNPYRYVNITGYRTSIQGVASFRFSSPSKAYASKWGDGRHTLGQISLAIFHERRPVAYIPHPVRPFHRLGRLTRNKRKGVYRSGGTSAPSKSADEAPRSLGRRRRIWRPRRNPKLGTAFGRYKHAPAQYTTFKRASIRPTYHYSTHYNSCAGFRALRILSSYCTPIRRPLIQRPHNHGFTPPPTH